MPHESQRPGHPHTARHARKTQQRSLLANVILVLLGLEAGVAFALALVGQPLVDWTHLASGITALSRLAAMTGTFLTLVCLVLISRLPWLEREFGQDRLTWWHRKFAPYSLYLILAHVLLVALGYGMTINQNLWVQFWQLVLGTPWMMPAFVGFIFMMMIGITSYKRARSKMKYETWWLLHLYSYLGIALAFMHQIDSGTMFINNTLLRNVWIGLYVQVAALIIGFRVVQPLVRSFRHDLRVERVVRETADTVSVIFKGRDLASLGARGGQFFSWRFLGNKSWWEGHPYSLSAAPRADRMRITVKDLGDHSKWLAKVRPGTRVIFEGPYGVFTADRAEKSHVVLIAGGVGVTPIRALLEELPRSIDVDLIWRASTAAELPLRREIEELAKARDARVHMMVGSRKQFPLSAGRISHAVPNIANADVFLCGPEGLVAGAIEALEDLGVAHDSIHDETFAY